MDVTTIAAGKLRLERAEVNLVALARDVVSHFKEEAARVGCTLTFVADGPLVGWWDGFRMEQVVTNLLANALKYGAGKPVEVSVGAEGRLARLTVRDHGIGLEPEDAERIFERFERASSATSYAGLGLGLYIVRQIVALHGGAIHVDSRPGDGAAFTVDLPLGTGARWAEGRGEPRALAAAPPPPPTSPSR
jgi:signal transduction histidine kinase